MRNLRLLGRAAAVLFASLFLSLHASGQNADARARGLNRDAMEDDYLATNMKAALAKLQTALRSCKKGRCKKETLAQVHANLGIVYSAGLNQHAAAVEAFKQALSLQPSITPDANYLTSGVQKAFEEAKGSAAPVTEAPRAEQAPRLEDKPWPEQAVFNPVPIYVELPEGTTAARVVVRYRAPGQSTWRDVLLKPHGRGFGGYIPCSAVGKPGTLVYFVTASNLKRGRSEEVDQTSGAVQASAGSAEEPRSVRLEQSISGSPPALPDSEPPAACPRSAERAGCETDDDCSAEQTCDAGACVEQRADVDAEATEPVRRKNWFGVSVSPDFMMMSATDDACSVQAQADGNVGCFFSDRSRWDLELAADQRGGNTISSGFALLGTLRLMLTYERLLGTRFLLGLRLGYTHFGPPEDFVPLHAEARIAFHFKPDAFADKGLRPYVFAGGGFGPAAGRVGVEVVELRQNEGYTLDAYQSAGPGFAAIGPGLQLAVSEQLALALEVAGRAMLPEFALVVAPQIGAAYGF